MRRSTPARAARRAFILPVVLVLVALLALALAGFIFFVRAETAGTVALRDQQQARLAAESGLEYVTAILRAHPHDSAYWFDSAERFRHVLVFGEGFDRESDPVKKQGSRADILAQRAAAPPAWRFSCVGPSVSGVEGTMRFGITPESGKLNLNAASDSQIEQICTPLLANLSIENPQEIVNAILDWRDGDTQARPGGAEQEYYDALTPPYRVKNGPFDTVEELLLVKGVTAAVLYGEDTNRNGILDANENDGEESAPAYDNADGILNRGIADYFTVSSREPETALDNKPRINLLGNAGQISAQLATLPEGEVSETLVAFLLSLKQQNFDFSLLRSPADLYPNPNGVPGTGVPAIGAEAAPATQPSGEQVDEGQPPAEGDAKDAEPDPQPESNGKAPVRRQNKQPVDEPEKQEEPVEGEQPKPQPQAPQPRGGGAAGGPRQGPRAGAGGGGQRSGGRQATDQLEQLKSSPVTDADLAVLLDRFTVRNPSQAQNGVIGLVNVNTAPAEVLATIPNITPDAVGAILANRTQLDAAQARTPAWVLTTGAADVDTFQAIAPYLTTKAYQFHVEVVGYADHVRTAQRHEWIIEMIGPLAQVRYYRDLTALGLAWPIDDDTIVVEQRR